MLRGLSLRLANAKRVPIAESYANANKPAPDNPLRNRVNLRIERLPANGSRGFVARI